MHIYDNDVLNCDNLYTIHAVDIEMMYIPILYPWLKFGGGKWSSWTGRQDGWGKKR